MKTYEKKISKKRNFKLLIDSHNLLEIQAKKQKK